MREALLPSFYTTMAFRDKVSDIITEVLKEKPSLFLVDFTITEAFKVIIILDGDNGVNLQDCIDVSRAIENNLDREEQDSSSGARVVAGLTSQTSTVQPERVGRFLFAQNPQLLGPAARPHFFRDAKYSFTQCLCQCLCWKAHPPLLFPYGN
jgi:ribosome maturation factor RimP